MTNPDDNQVVAALDENSRRYYLDAMGVQCWQLLESEDASLATQNVVAQDVASDVENSEQSKVLSRGNTSAEIMIVLLSPSANDNTVGELCSGEEGVLLTKMLAAINVSIAGVYITSLLQNHSVVDHVLSEDEMVQCDTYLKQQIQKVKPKVLIALGEATARFVLKQKTSLDTLREQSTAVYESIPLFLSYSPEELLQNTENKRKAWLDLQQLQKLLQQ